MTILLNHLLAQFLPGTMLFNDGDPDSKLADLQDRLLDLNEQIQTLQATADSENRDLNDDEAASIQTLMASFDETQAELDRRKRIIQQTENLRQSMGRQSEPQNPDPQNRADDNPPAQTFSRQPRQPNISVVDRPETRGRWGWRSLGEFANAVRIAGDHGGTVDPRLVQNAPTSFGSGSTGADGGFAVPPDFRESIMVKVFAEESLIARTDQMTSSGNSITMPKDETTAWQTTGGIQAHWEGEGNQIQQSKIALLEETIRLSKLTVLVPMTDELLEDASALDTYLRRKAPDKMDFKVTDAIINGDGVGKPAGILPSSATVVVAKEAGQAADTVVFNNIVKMWSRMYARSRSSAIWLVNQDIEPQLLTMSFEGNSSSVPAYMPANGLSASPFGTLMGRPVIPTEACPTLGDKGDIILADMSQYLTATKTQGIRAETSMHLWFDYDVTAFKFVMRVAGKPWFDAPIQPKNGSATRSPFVTLAERA